MASDDGTACEKMSCALPEACLHAKAWALLAVATADIQTILLPLLSGLSGGLARSQTQSVPAQAPARDVVSQHVVLLCGS